MRNLKLLRFRRLGVHNLEVTVLTQVMPGIPVAEVAQGLPQHKQALSRTAALASKTTFLVRVITGAVAAAQQVTVAMREQVELVAAAVVLVGMARAVQVE